MPKSLQRLNQKLRKYGLTPVNLEEVDEVDSPMSHLEEEGEDEEQVEEEEVLSLKEFIEWQYPTYKFYAWNTILIEELQKVAEGETLRLMVFCPPQHGKTSLCSKIFPAYLVYRYPHLMNGIASYTIDVAIIASRFARRLWKGAGGKNQKDADSATYWETLEGGGCWAAGIGGSSSGKPITGCAILDDPLKGAQEARSEAIKLRNEEWLEAEWQARLAEFSPMVLVQTRWTLNDPAAYFLGKAEPWRILSFSAIHDEALRENSLFIPDHHTLVPDFRKDGEPLCPEIRSLKRLETIKSNISPYNWLALYQQTPVQRDGVIYSVENIQYYSLATAPEFQGTYVSVDCNFKETSTGSFVVMQHWGVNYPKFYLTHQIRKRMSFSATKRNLTEFLTDMTALYGPPDRILVEGKANGDAIISELKDEFMGIKEINPTESKEARYEASSGPFDGQQIYTPDPEDEPWVAEWKTELGAVPYAPNDDQADATAQLILFIKAIAQARAKARSRKTPTSQSSSTNPIPPRKERHTYSNLFGERP